MLNCIAYKLCDYKVGQMNTEYGKPAGYDRARGREIGRKNIELTTMEEAFTSEHWIVRIFKVKKRRVTEELLFVKLCCFLDPTSIQH